MPDPSPSRKIGASLTQTYTVKCCKVTRSFEWEHQAIGWILGHIRRKHASLLPIIEERARKSALSQNGMGYYDGAGKSKTGGWHDAQPSFREAWRENAIRRILNEQKVAEVA